MSTDKLDNWLQEQYPVVQSRDDRHFAAKRAKRVRQYEATKQRRDAALYRLVRLHAQTLAGTNCYFVDPEFDQDDTLNM